MIRYKLAVIWSADLPASKQINKLIELWPKLSSMKTSEFLAKMKESSEWIFAEKCTLEVAQELCLNAQKERINIVMIPEKVWPE